jgi:hypothetical protein
MKTIKIKMSGHDPKNQFSYGYPILRALEKHYQVEFSDEPDFLFTNGSNLEYLDHDCARIFYTGENEHPNFNLFDYAISFDHMEFGDRHFRFPVHQMAVFYHPEDIKNAGDLDFKTSRPFTSSDLAIKTEFCSFVYSNYLADPARDTFFNLLSDYKQVSSGGRYKNNVGGPVVSKLDFEKKHKFSIAFENSSRAGYTTEKIFCSLAADTIPIYYGDPRVGETFNEKRFINAMKYPNFAAVVERVKEIDQNDELYLAIMNEPILNPGIDFRKDREEFGQFLKHIMDQQPRSALRIHINPARRKVFEENERVLMRIRLGKQRLWAILAFIYRPFKKIAVIEKIKIMLSRKIKL